MPSIIEIEVKNLSTEEKEVLYKHLKVYRLKKFDPNNLDKLLESYFWNFPADFIAFQKGYKYSIYNQTIQENNFKDLDYEDVVEGLTQDQKNRIIEYIRLNAKYLKDEDANDYDDPFIEEITAEDRELIEKAEKIEELPKADQEKFWEEFEKPWHHFPDEIENYKNSKYILVKPDEYIDTNRTELKFFKNEKELILYALKNKTIASGILSWHEKYLNPHYQVNRWIETKYKRDQKQKDNQEQAQKFEKPKMKNIVDLEINNLPDQVKEEYYKLIRKRIEDNKDWRRLVGDEDWKYFKDNHTFDELLEVGFRKYPQEFIAFQKKYKNSLYNKTLKQHNFKDLGYKDVVKDLSQEEKEGIIDEILIQVPYLSTRDYPVVYLEEIDKKFIEKNQWLYSREELEQYYQNKFILTKVSRYPKDDKRSVEIPPIINKFFKNEDEVIVFVMEDGRMTHEILNSCTDNLNPHHKVNNLIEKKYELEQLKKDKTISKNKKVEQPKKKM